MTKHEIIKLIEFAASVISIMGWGWASIKFVFKPYFKNRMEYEKICIVVKDCFKRWNELNYSARGGAMISHDDFLIVNKYRKRFKNKNLELKAYLFRNALQNGLGGNWGYWLYLNKDNVKIISPLVLGLNKSAGFRPNWRSAYILEKLFLKNIDKLDLFVNAEKLQINDKSILEIIKNNKVESEIHRMSIKGTKEEKEKIQLVIEELDKFSKDIDAFAKEQTIIT